jgi:hypothetical protein
MPCPLSMYGAFDQPTFPTNQRTAGAGSAGAGSAGAGSMLYRNASMPGHLLVHSRPPGEP